MEENISKFVTAIIAIFILFIFPVYTAYEKKDDISYALAVRYTQEFVDNVRKKGYITSEIYNDYKARLLTTGNTYAIELEHEYVRYDGDYVDKNAGSATRNTELFTNNHIINILNNGQVYAMNKDDNFNVKIKNTNVTLATVIYNIVTVNTSSNNVRIFVDYGGRIIAEKWYEQGLEYSEYGGIVSEDGYRIEFTINDLDVDKETIGDVVINTDVSKLYLSNNVRVGDYVEYYPDGTGCLPSDFSKYSPLNGKCRDNNTKWQVLSIDRENNKVTLISEGNALSSTYTVNSSNTEYGKNVNHNLACNKLFSNSKLGTARNVTREDITRVPSLTKSNITYLLTNYVSQSVAYYDWCNYNHIACSVPCHDITISFYEYSGTKDSRNVRSNCQFSWNSWNPGELSLRPVVELNEGVLIDATYTNGCGDTNIANCGTKTNPWKLSVESAEVKTLGETVQIGDYVAYTPDKNTSTISIPSSISGYSYSLDQEFKQVSSGEWKVLKVTGDKVYLISQFSAGGLVLGGFAGVNNGIQILNNICRTFYSREGVATARALTYDDLDMSRDIEDHSTYVLKYEPGNVFAIRYYPSIYARSSYNGSDIASSIEWQSKDIGEYIIDNNRKSVAENKFKIFTTLNESVILGDLMNSNFNKFGIGGGSWIAYLSCRYTGNNTLEWFIDSYMTWGSAADHTYRNNDHVSAIYMLCDSKKTQQQLAYGIQVVVEIDANVLVNTLISGDGSSKESPIRLAL